MEINNAENLPSILAMVPRLADDDKLWKRVCAAAEKQRSADISRWDVYRQKFSAGETSENDEVNANYDFAYVNMMLAYIAANPSTIEVEPQGAGELSLSVLVQLGLFPDLRAARRKFASVLEQVLQGTATACCLDEVNEEALQEALLTGLGVTKESFDGARQLARSDALKRHEIYIDPNARVRLEQARYVVQICTLPLDEARVFFESKGVMGIQPNYTLNDEKGIRGNMAREAQPESDKDQYKFYEIWVRDARGDNQVIYRTWETDRTLFVDRWPFQLDHDDFPYTLFTFNKLYCQVKDAFPDLKVISSLRRAQQDLTLFHYKSVLRGLAKKLLYDRTMGEEALKKALSNRDFEPVPVDPKGRSLKDMLHLLDLNENADKSLIEAVNFKGQADEITGQDELLRGADSGPMTAQEADIRDANGKMRTGRRQNFFDRGQNRQVQHLAQITRQLVPDSVVAALCEDEGDNGELVKNLWNTLHTNAGEFRQSYAVRVAAGSTSQRAKREKNASLERTFALLNQRNIDLIGLGQPPKWDVDELIRERVRGDNLDPDRYELDAEEQSAALQPMQQAAGMPVEPAGAAPDAGAEGLAPVLPSQPAQPGAPVPMSPAQQSMQMNALLPQLAGGAA